MEPHGPKHSGLHTLGLIVLAAGALLGGWLGNEYRLPDGSGDGTFNWTLCLLATPAGVVAACVCFAGAHIVDQMRGVVGTRPQAITANGTTAAAESTTPLEHDHRPGWYPDPYGEGDNALRYWDGTQWTRSTQPDS